MKEGKIRKTTSYIMAVPMNDLDIDTPQMIYDRINESKEFELKEISFDDKNRCPMVTVEYKEKEYIVDLKIEAMEIPPDFMVAHPLNETCLKKLKKAKIGLTVAVTFNDDIQESYHFQIKLLNCILPEKAAVVDFNTHRILSPQWIELASSSSVSPGPNYIFSVTVLPISEDRAYIFTYGLNRCGYYELETINVERKNANFIAVVMNIAANKAICDGKFPDESEAMEIAVLDKDNVLKYTWKFWEDDISGYPENIPGTGNLRPLDRNLYNGMLYIYPIQKKNKKPCKANEYPEMNINDMVIEISNSETKRSEVYAAETLSLFLKGLAVPEAKALVKFKTEAVNSSETLNHEHIWAEVEESDQEGLKCLAIQDSVYSDEIKKGDKIQIAASAVSDWVLNIGGKKVTPDTAFLLKK